jgi:hypothetical protein
MWVRFSTVASKRLIGQGIDGSSFWTLRRLTDVLDFRCNVLDASQVWFRCPWTPSQDVWYHIEFSRVDNSNASTGWRMFIDGVNQSLTLMGGAWNANLPNFAEPLNIGLGYTGDTASWLGWLDEVRVSKGICRHTSDFTPPAVAYSAAGGDSPSITIKSNGTQTAKLWTDGNASDSFKIDVASTTRVQIATDGEIQIPSDFTTGAAGALSFGAAQDAEMGYDGTNLVINPKLVGTGKVSILGGISLLDQDVVLGTTTGTKIGTATTQKIGFWNATPVVQPTAVADATDAASVITQLNALLAKLRTLGIIAT